MSESAHAIDGSDLARVSLDGVAIVDGGRIVRANERLTEIHGSPDEGDLVGHEWRDLYDPAEPDCTADDLLARVRAEGEWSGRALGRRWDGSDVPVVLSLCATSDCIVCVVAEASERGGRPIDGGSRSGSDGPRPIDLLENLLDAIDDVVYVVDEDDDVVYWNSRLNERLGYSDEEVADLDLPEFLGEEDRDLLAGSDANMVDLPDRASEMTVVSKDGERIRHELRGATYTDEASGRRYRVGVARDVSGRVERDERLERYETIFETIDDGVYVLDEDLRVDMANKRFFEMMEGFGFSREAVLDMHAHDLVVDEDERAHLESEIERAVEAEPHTGSFEMSAETSDGESVAFESRFRLYPDPDGEHRGCIGILRDITERKQREQELRDSRRFNEQLVENAPFGMFHLDEDLRITYENPRAEEIIGLPEDEAESAAIGVDIRELPSIVETGQADLFSRLQDGETIEFEFSFESIYGREAYFTGRGVPISRDGEFAGAVLMANDISERRQHERDLERQRDELDTLNEINALLLAVARDLFESPIQGDIEQTVCDRLADSDLYQFAWIGKPEVGGDRLVPDAVAGVDDDYVESITVTTDESDTGRGPAGRAFRTGAVQVSQDIRTDPDFQPWREAAIERGVRSAAAVPLAYDGTTYGVLAVHASRPLAFSRRERRGFEILGEAIGYAINASRTRQLLFAEQVSELEFRLGDAEAFPISTCGRLDCRLSLESYISAGEDTWLMYFSPQGPGTDVDRFADLARDDPAVETVRTVGSDVDRVVAVTASSTLLDEVTTLGGRVTSATFEAERGTVVVEVPQSTGVAEFVEQIRSTYPGADLLAKRDGERPAERSAWLSGDDPVDLTDRQRQALEAAYLAGYFEWPRESTAEDVADLLDISRPTLQAHLRKAERELLRVFLEGAGDRGGPAAG